MRGIGPLEIGLIILAIVLLFGVGKLGQIGGSLGKSIREFRRERDRKNDHSDASTAEANSQEPAVPDREDAPSAKHCPSCGGSISARAKFCMQCGAQAKSHALKPW